MGFVDLEFAPFASAAVQARERQALATALVTREAQARARALARHHADALATRTTGLAALFEGWRPGVLSAAALVAPLLARADEPSPDPVHRVALAAAQGTVAGGVGAFSARFLAPSRVRFGAWVTPPCRTLVVEPDADGTWLTLDAAPRRRLDDLAAAGDGRLPTASMRGVELPLLGEATADLLSLDPRALPAAVGAEAVGVTLEAAMRLLEAHAPGYAAWVGEVLAAVVPIRAAREDVTQSFCTPAVPGVVYASFPAPPLKTAELLVHECSHTYFHIGELDTLFANGMDPALYYSPYVERDRPIDRILIAFHAFANIVLFYRAALAGGLAGDDRRLAEAAISFHLRHLPAMRDQLDASPGLSPTGRGLYAPLRDELFS